MSFPALMSLLHEVEAHVSTRRLRPRYFIHSIGELHDVALLVLDPSSTYHTAVDAVVHCSGILYIKLILPAVQIPPSDILGVYPRR